MNGNRHLYVIITPVRNEEQYIEKTIQSVIAQTVKPVKWVIVNDGSTDRTGEIIKKYTDQFDWIEALTREDQGFRAGAGPAEAFNKGLPKVKEVEFDFIVNLDGDLSFNPTYFEDLLKRFDENPRLGIGSGKALNMVDGKPVLCRCLDTSTMGASKVYRKACFENLGGALIQHICWDMLDDLNAKMKGWETRSFPDITFIHYKPIGTRQGNTFATFFRQGRLLYQYGYDPLYLVAKSFYRGLEKPYLIITAGVIAGYFSAVVKRLPRELDNESIKFLRAEQRGRLFLRK